MMGHAYRKVQNLLEARRLYFLAPQGLTDIELARRLGVDRASAYRYRRELEATPTTGGRYTLVPTEQDAQMARAILLRAHQCDTDRLEGEEGNSPA